MVNKEKLKEWQEMDADQKRNYNGFLGFIGETSFDQKFEVFKTRRHR